MVKAANLFILASTFFQGKEKTLVIIAPKVRYSEDRF